MKKGSWPSAFGICSLRAWEGDANPFSVGSGLVCCEYFFPLFSLSLPGSGSRDGASMREWGLSVQMLPGEAEVPTPCRKWGLTEPGWGLRKWQQGWSRDDGRGEAKWGGPGMEGGHLFLEPWLGGGVYCKALFTPRAEWIKWPCLLSVSWMDGTGRGGRGGCIIVNSAIYNFFFFFFFLIIFSPATHCCRDKRIKGETLFLPFPISAVYSKSPGRSLLGWKCQTTELWMRCRAWSCCSWPHSFPKFFPMGWDLSPQGSECPFPRGTIGHNKTFATTIGWFPFCTWIDAAAWPLLPHTGTLFPGNSNIQEWLLTSLQFLGAELKPSLKDPTLQQTTCSWCQLHGDILVQVLIMVCFTF